ncbi:MAG TPA: OsmC family peroxiredoxin [Gammaproteobacteria bacterium]|nr:OsmC family peroxiredoxin [Gammaproteobacteria bacterium]
MSEYCAKIYWVRGREESFIDNKYSRGHRWDFDGGITVPASSSPHVVPLPFSVEENIDPEEAFVASLSSCHMLFFLSIVAKRQYIVDEYVDRAVGFMALNTAGKMYMKKVILRPDVVFSGEKQPDVEVIKEIHHLSHAECFIANSVKTEISIEINGLGIQEYV